MKVRYLLLSLCVLCSTALFAQEESPEELFEDGDFFFAREDFEEAAYLYRQVLLSEPDNPNVHYKLGMAYLNIEGQEAEAIPHFLRATEQTSLKYRKNYYKERNAPHHTWFYLGNAYRINNQLDEALDAYEKFRAPEKFEKKYNPGVLQAEIDAVSRAKIIQDAPLDLYRFCFPEPVNSSSNEYNAVISADENVLVWMNSQKFYEAIMMSVKQDGKWSTPVNITPQVGSDGEMAPTGLSADGTKLLLVKHNDFDSDIYISEYDGTLWSHAEPIPGEINSNFTEDHASFSADGKKIVFSSERRGSLGGLDLFISELESDGRWGFPVNLGDKINTEVNETSAYFSPDSKKLVFSSEGHFNMGGYDIFESDISENGEIGIPFNIGYPINTTNNNTYFIPLKDGNSGVYSFRSDEGIGGKDTWFVEIVPFEQLIAKALTRLSNEDFTLQITDKETGEEILLDYDAINDKISIHSASGKTYSVIYSRKK